MERYEIDDRAASKRSSEKASPCPIIRSGTIDREASRRRERETLERNRLQGVSSM